MADLWIPVTIAAAFLQCLRTALQKRLTKSLSAEGANFIRYVYGFPIAILLLVLLSNGFGRDLPMPNAASLSYGAIGGLTQIAATSLLIRAFTYRSFVVGTTYSKTETIQAALLAVLILGEHLDFWGWGAIMIGFIGIVVMSRAAAAGAGSWADEGTRKAALVGLGSGTLFGICAVAIRASALALPEGNELERAAVTLASITAMQAAMMAVYLLLRDPKQIAEVFRLWPRTFPVGLLSVAGSCGWFFGMTLENAALVRALGQVELVFTYLASHLIFRERATAGETLGILLVAGSVVLLILR
ncbi:MAG: DMT family transporter [Alphaproteobacteria bacterium]|nr:DMT family transporter [Alphaproteobacteria bacterium]